jgi:hypothetical protein
MANSRMFGASKDTKTTGATNIEKNVDQIFTTYSSNPYRIALRDRVKDLKSQTMPVEEILDCFPIKIHISIAKKDAIKVYIDLVQLLLNAIAEGIINEFKHTRLDMVEAEYIAANTELEKVNIFKKYLIDDVMTIPATEEAIAKEWKEFLSSHNDVIYFTDKHLLSLLQEQSETTKRMMSRLMEGSQFTVYLPMKYDLFGISKLQNNVSRFLTDKKMDAGKTTAAQSRIDNFVSLRLETLDGEYVSATTSDQGILDKVQEHQSHSELYQYLQKHKDDKAVPFKKADFYIKESDDPCIDPFINDNKAHSVNPSL